MTLTLPETQTAEEAVATLDLAAKMASDDAVHTSDRWAAWFTFQTGYRIPLDLFTEYASALDLLGYYEQYAPTEMGRLHAEAGVQHYRKVIVSIIVTKAVR